MNDVPAAKIKMMKGSIRLHWRRFGHLLRHAKKSGSFGIRQSRNGYWD